jgi:putative transposase
VTAPRRVLPARTYLLTRRCLERRFYLRPDPKVTQIFEYLLAVACTRYGIQLHAYVMMSNHYHLVVTDRLANLPPFQQYLNSLLARAINQYRSHWGQFWDRESYNAVELLEHDAVLTKLAYTELNPVRAGLVGRATAWSGPTSSTLRFGHTRRIQRPEGFFSPSMPEEAILELLEPADIDRQDAQASRDHALADGCRTSRSTQPRPLGMRRVLRRDWKDSPSTPEPRRQLRPRFASRCPELRIRALVEYRRWLDAYRAALQRFRDGERQVPFPAGSFWMCVRLGCPPAPS